MNPTQEGPSRPGSDSSGTGSGGTQMSLYELETSHCLTGCNDPDCWCHDSYCGIHSVRENDKKEGKRR